MIAKGTVWDNVSVVCHVFDGTKGCGELGGEKGEVNPVVIFVWVVHLAGIISYIYGKNFNFDAII
jgi:hypothetical protein